MQHNKIITLLLCLVLFPATGFCASPSSLVNKGNSAYAAGKYDKALKAYEEASVDAPESPQIFFNQGAAYYKKGDYAKAKDAWEKAALKSKDISLEAKATFNLGNNAFKEAQRQKDSDLQKSLDACKESINNYQQVLDLLKGSKKADDAAIIKDASENIEMVRLVMKSILDAIKKQEEQQKKKQQAANDLKKLIDKQKELINRNQYYAEEKQKKGESQQLKDNISQMAKDQNSLKQETKAVADKLPDASQTKKQVPNQIKEAKNHLNKAVNQQQDATGKIDADKLSDAKINQESALDEMKKALSSMEKQNQQAGQGKQKQQEKQEAQQGQKKGQQGASGNKQDQAKNNNQNNQQNARLKKQEPGQHQDTAQSILDEEKQNRENQRTRASGGYQSVDKDW